MSDKLIWLDDAIAAVQSSPFPIQALAALPAVSPGVKPEVAALVRAVAEQVKAIREQVTVTRSYAAESDMGKNNVSLMENCTSHFLDFAAEMDRALAAFEKEGRA